MSLMESAKLSTKIQILLWKGHQLEAPEEASQPRDHCQTHACGIISDFAGALCAAHAASVPRPVTFGREDVCQ